LTPYLYILPALIVVVGIVYTGIGYTGWASTLDWNGIDPNPTNVGLQNFATILTDGIFWKTIEHTVIFGIATIFLQMALGLLMAVLLSSSAVRAKGLYRVIVFLPVVLAPAVVASAFRQIFGFDGQFNELLHAVGLGSLAQSWLANPNLALYTLIVIQVWQWTGFSFILYHSSLAQIDANILDAAAIDGAGSWKTLRWVVMPQLNGTHAILVLLGTISALKTFDLVYLTTEGGPARSTEFLPTYIYQQVVDQFNTGYGAALSLVLLVLALALTAVQMRITKIEV
jgi:raffinose/stachyose/melibiose transport system permease protein